MKYSVAHLASTLVIAAAIAGLVSSCGAPVVATGEQTIPSRGAVHIAAGHIAQLDFGRHAGFATCLSAACPEVTPKTLPGGPLPAPPALPAVEPTAPPDRDEIVLPIEARPVAASAPAALSTPRPSGTTASWQVVVHFAFGDATLSPAERILIDEAAEAVPSARHVAISGRTDSVGPPQVNQSLALARAEAVRDHLRPRHPRLAPAVTVQAEGACCYVASNDTRQGRAMNRRVEIVFERDADDS